MMIAETLRGNGFKPGILTRGYGGKSKKQVNVVCDGKSILSSHEWVGDEAVMMAEKLKNVPIITGSDRFQTGRYALENFEIDSTQHHNEILGIRHLLGAGAYTAGLL